MQELDELFKTIDLLFKSCNLDYEDLINQQLNLEFFEDHSKVRTVNSFLFNYSKIQDKIGSKLLKRFLLEFREIDSEAVSMRDTLNVLEKLRIIEDSGVWERLREIRNNLSHEYPTNIKERVQNIKLALEGFEILKKIYGNLKNYFLKNRNST